MLSCADCLLKSMTNWHDPALQEAEDVAHVKFVHVMGGLFIWEFLLNLDFEYSIMSGRRKFTRTSLIYIASRWFTLLLIIVEFLGFDSSQRIDCQAQVSTLFTFGTLAYLSASALIILRIYALWERQKVVVAVVSVIWLANAVSYVYTIATTYAHRVDGICVTFNPLRNRIYIFSTFISDLAFLAFTLTGVLRWKTSRQKDGIWWLLYTQGLVWVVAFTLAEVPPVVFIILNLNNSMNRMFPFPGLILMTVAASRMYLGLVNSAAFHSPPVSASGAKGQSTEKRIEFASVPDSSHPTEGTGGTGGRGFTGRSYTSTGDAAYVELGTHRDEKPFGGETV